MSIMKEVKIFHTVFIQKNIRPKILRFFTAAQNTNGNMTRFRRRIQNTKSTKTYAWNSFERFSKILGLRNTFV